MSSRRIDVDTERLWAEFHEVVNMSSPELRGWLLTEAVDEHGALPESDVDELGEHVLRILSKRKVDLTRDDLDTMSRVVEIIRTELADPPPAGASDSRWRHSLMDLGHDPLHD